MIEFFSGKQRHVCRSTFGAELHNLTETAEWAMFLAGYFQEVFWGVCTAEKIANMMQNGQLDVQIRIGVDAKSVHDAWKAEKTNVPCEAQLLHVLKALKAHFDEGRLDACAWIDTEDMVSDALTKGGVARKAILAMMATAWWTPSKPWSVWRPLVTVNT